MTRVELDPDAQADLDQIYDYIGRQHQNPLNADRFLDKIAESCRLYATQPNMGEARQESLD